MRALILNSGMGRRMGGLALGRPKCLTKLGAKETILSRQLGMLAQAGICEAVMTIGPFGDMLPDYCKHLGFPIHITYVRNPAYKDTNYIYSIYCARECLDDDIILMHGDLVFEEEACARLLDCSGSCMAVSSSLPLPEKDFKAVVRDGRVAEIGVGFFDGALAAQPFYKLGKGTWKVWLDKICEFCESGDEKKRRCYAEDAFNLVSGSCGIRPLDLGDLLCAEVDGPDDLAAILRRLDEGTGNSVRRS